MKAIALVEDEARADSLGAQQPALSATDRLLQARLSGVPAARLNTRRNLRTTSHQPGDSSPIRSGSVPSARGSCPLCLVAYWRRVQIQQLQIRANETARNPLELARRPESLANRGRTASCCSSFDRAHPCRPCRRRRLRSKRACWPVRSSRSTEVVDASLAPV